MVVHGLSLVVHSTLPLITLRVYRSSKFYEWVARLDAAAYAAGLGLSANVYTFQLPFFNAFFNLILHIFNN